MLRDVEVCATLTDMGEQYRGQRDTGSRRIPPPASAPPPAPSPRERVDVRIAPAGLAIVRDLAKTEDRSLSDMLRILVMEALAARKLLGR